MTIGEMEALCASIEDKEMQIVMSTGFEDEVLITVCKENSEVISMPVINDEYDLYDEDGNEIPEEQLEHQEVLLLVPCGCFDEPELGEINSQPELN